jgi:hypothetical protein
MSSLHPSIGGARLYPEWRVGQSHREPGLRGEVGGGWAGVHKMQGEGGEHTCPAKMTTDSQTMSDANLVEWELPEQNDYSSLKYSHKLSTAAVCL